MEVATDGRGGPTVGCAQARGLEEAIAHAIAAVGGERAVGRPVRARARRATGRTQAPAVRVSAADQAIAVSIEAEVTDFVQVRGAVLEGPGLIVGATGVAAKEDDFIGRV